MTGAGAWSLTRGANTLETGGTRFSVWAPNAERVTVRIRSGSATGDHVLDRTEGGVFEGVVSGARAGDDYAYVLNDDGRELPDPVSRFQPAGVHGPSRIVEPARFAWSDGAWTGLAMPDFIIYELHVGTFTSSGTFDGVIPLLHALRDLGVTAIELMPVAQFPGTRNWGYDGVDLYAPQNSYGGPAALKRLVDAAHHEGLAVVLDVVYNHLGPEGNYLGAFGPYFSERYHTPWGTPLNFDGPDSDEVRRFFIDNALYWITEYHIDALRLDAVHGIFDFSAIHILRELAERVHAQGARLGRRVQVLAECDLNDPTLVREPPAGDGLDAQWSDDFHHAVHVALTGEHTGYYIGYDGARDIAKAMGERFVYDGVYSRYRRRRHGAPAGDVSAEHFVVYVQNHDQVGNHAGGERLSTLLPFAKLKLAAALLLLSPYVPLLFMGEEYGEINPFEYFVSHTEPALVDAVRTGRRKEFASFGWADRVPDPQSEETFARSRLDRTALDGDAWHRALLAMYHDLLHLRRAQPALRPGNARVQVTSDAEQRWVMLALTPPDGRALCAVFNLDDDEHTLALPALDAGERWTRIFATNAPAYATPRDRAPAPTTSRADHATVAPFSAVLYARRAERSRDSSLHSE
ncbi:MAG TPA: malto-oligosyltrehalose trehalohydrolase [Gemmatimonadaceae bacterium]